MPFTNQHFIYSENYSMGLMDIYIIRFKAFFNNNLKSDIFVSPSELCP